MDILFAALITILILFKFMQVIKVIIQLKNNILFPEKENDVNTIRMRPEKPMKGPSLSKQKNAILLWSLFLVFILTFSYLEIYFLEYGWMYSLIIVMPLFYMPDFLNLFAISEKGIVGGTKFLSWHHIKSYKVDRIDINHNFYGFDKDVNDKNVIKVEGNFSSVSVIVTDKDVLNKLTNLLDEKLGNITSTKEDSLSSDG